MTESRQAPPIRLLLIDDDEDEYILHRDLLGEVSRSRYVLDWAPNYAKGLEALLSGEHDAFLIDYRLGEKTGWSSSARCRPLRSSASPISRTISASGRLSVLMTRW